MKFTEIILRVYCPNFFLKWKQNYENHYNKDIPNFNDLIQHYYRKLLRFKILRCCFDGTDEELKRVQNYWRTH